MNEEGVEKHQFFESVSYGFTEAVRRAMRVAARNEEGDLISLSQTELAERSEVGRSTLAKYLGAGRDDPANPTLDVICRLAETLGVPPAFLLMRPKDWTSIGSATTNFAMYAKLPEARAKFDKLAQMQSTTSPAIADAAIELGQFLGVIEDDKNTQLTKEVRDFWRAAEAATAAIGATIPFGYDGVSKIHISTLLTICSFVGTSTARN